MTPQEKVEKWLTDNGFKCLPYHGVKMWEDGHVSVEDPFRDESLVEVKLRTHLTGRLRNYKNVDLIWEALAQVMGLDFSAPKKLGYTAPTGFLGDAKFTTHRDGFAVIIDNDSCDEGETWLLPNELRFLADYIEDWHRRNS